MQVSYLNLDEDVILDMDAYSRRKRPADFKKRNLLRKNLSDQAQRKKCKGSDYHAAAVLK
ncbi:unnamed protein product [Prunus armeniaca]|uniref:Uncharacterized protein n=1 Tax=Prunus armeniaca TaxID=36596 RepID=A0A6J5Y9M9_PRUAR|nr:unnamed protein product [Prunus armeniaca]